ncbi:MULTISPECIES: DUF1353 domain-containing protein [Gordonia]|uniref:DUF1353 domain-containing protein n=1 Tax=Gordonia hongkongensis TaxID=1701090 RepID=A0ABT6BTD2_9ACTN|nr:MULTISPECIES: DUF1353 domain-containing protein [Gordonia]MBN0972335.1 DUF1353 domain-containing protein [Gordonia sp. BP-119]MBN0982441.1 DUF1353 domain-containing protein [Gordonia sp. BP-94]MDF6101284.1 DUF1353 domain-containing protein [Gordonia hongkongensis]WGJ85197.1 DUF1353 domain-containing protein [Gordonia sp. SMJS1]
MNETTPSDPRWVPWRVAPTSGFEVDDPTGRGEVEIAQIDERQFLVRNAFRFSDPAVEEYLVTQLVERGQTEADARGAVDAARAFVPGDDNPTDLASIPRFLRWFENPYGRHSLAALIHDELITGTVNSGALGSDTLSDRFFREMMRASGVPWLKRWIMWSAVALRTRWVAGGWRRLSVVAWLVLSLVGICAAVGSGGALLFDWSWPTSSPAVSLLLSLLMIFVAAPLWGRQWAASLVAAVAALWVLPAAIVAYFAYALYLLSERIARTVGLT